MLVADAGVKAVVVRDWKLSTENTVIALKPGHLLVRVAYARLTRLDVAVAVTPHFYREGRVVGFSAVGFTVETGVGAKRGVQGPVAVRGFSADFAPPLEGDGFAAEYASVPEELVAPISRAEPRYAYLVDTCIALEAYRAIVEGSREGPVLLVGGGPSSIALALKLAESGYRVEMLVYSEPCRRIAREGVGVQVLERLSGGGYDAVYLASPTFMLGCSVNGIESPLTILHPHVHLAVGCLNMPRRTGRFMVKVAWGLEPGLGGCMELLEKVWKLIGDHIAVVEGLNPPPDVGCLGVLLDVRASHG